MSRNVYYRLLFLAAAIWNCVAALVSVLVLANPGIRSYLGIAAPADRLSINLFALSVAVFGLGFYWVSASWAKASCAPPPLLHVTQHFTAGLPENGVGINTKQESRM